MGILTWWERELLEQDVKPLANGTIGAGCTTGLPECVGENVRLVEDPYEADVHNNPGVLILVCPACEKAIADGI